MQGINKKGLDIICNKSIQLYKLQLSTKLKAQRRVLVTQLISTGNEKYTVAIETLDAELNEIMEVEV